jgi:hypothetical protein
MANRHRGCRLLLTAKMDRQRRSVRKPQEEGFNWKELAKILN